MELKKNKYKKSEVEEIIKSVKEENSVSINHAKEKFDALLNENKRLSLELDEYKRKDALINASIKRAEEKAREIEQTAKLKYSLELENIKTFYLRFSAYFNYLLDKYPYYPQTNEAKEIYDSLIKIATTGTNPKDAVKDAEKVLKSAKNKPFNPQEKINDYIAATTDNGFDLDQVLNPGELHLEDLCKELGLIEEE